MQCLLSKHTYRCSQTVNRLSTWTKFVLRQPNGKFQNSKFPKLLKYRLISSLNKQIRKSFYISIHVFKTTFHADIKRAKVFLIATNIR